MTQIQKRSKQKQFQKDNILSKIYESLGYNNDEDASIPSVEKTRQQLKLGGVNLNQSLNQLSQKSQKKKRKVRQLLGSINSKYSAQIEPSDQMKQLQWRLQVLREDRKQKQIRQKNKESLTFDELYKRQKNKYIKFRDRQKVKVNDPKYLQMIGSMQMRKQKKKLQSMEKIGKNIQKLDINIGSHTKEKNKNKTNSQWISQ